MVATLRLLVHTVAPLYGIEIMPLSGDPDGLASCDRPVGPEHAFHEVRDGAYAAIGF